MGDTNVSRYVGNGVTATTDPSGLIRPGGDQRQDIVNRGNVRIANALFGNETPRSSVDNVGGDRPATQLLGLGRDSVRNGLDVDRGGFSSRQRAIIDHGANLARRNENPAFRLGFHDEFGSHMSFCMSCHDNSNPDSRVKMGVAQDTANNSWGVFIGRDFAPMAIDLVFTAGIGAGARRAAAVHHIVPRASGTSRSTRPFASITRGSRNFNGRPTAIVDGQAELFGLVSRAGNEPLRNISTRVFGRQLPRGTRLRLVEDGIQLTEPGGVRSIRGLVTMDQRTVHIVEEHIENTVLLVDELGHVLGNPARSPNYHHRVAFRMLRNADNAGRVRLTAQELEELALSIARAKMGH